MPPERVNEWRICESRMTSQALHLRSHLLRVWRVPCGGRTFYRLLSPRSSRERARIRNNARLARLRPLRRPAQRAEQCGHHRTTDLSTQDAKDFLSHVATVDQLEIQLGKLAVTRGTSSEVRKFGQMMIDDHTSSTDKLVTLEKDLKLDTPRELDGKHKDVRERPCEAVGIRLRPRVCERDG